MADVKHLIKEAMRAKTLHRYQKFGTVQAVRAPVGQRIATVVDGKTETTNIAKPGDWLVIGPKGEEYLIGDVKFRERYVATAKLGVYKAVGECWATEYHGPNIEFKAPWGEPMVLETGDYLCTTKVGSDDIYRIERGAFEQTYRRAK